MSGIITLFLLFFVCIQVQGQNNWQFNQILQNRIKQLSITKEQLRDIQTKHFQVQLNRIEQIQIQLDKLYITHLKFKASQRINVNLYSAEISFGFLYDIKSINQHVPVDLSQQIFKFKQKILSQDFLIKKMQRNNQYKHFLSFQPQQKSQELQQTQIQMRSLFIALYIPSRKFGYKLVNNKSKFQLNVIATSSITIFQQTSLQKFVQFTLNSSQLHLFRLNTTDICKRNNESKSSIFQEQNQQAFIFHIMHIVGDFQYDVSFYGLFTNGKNNSQIQTIKIDSNVSQSTFYVKRSFIEEQNQRLKDNYIINKGQNQAVIYQSYIQFKVRCTSVACNFISQIERNHQIRNVVPGIPYIYSINKQQIFRLQNSLDLQITIDMNKKKGFAQYQICSTKNTNTKQNQCIIGLGSPSSTTNLFEVRQIDDKLHAFGRNNEIIINPGHESYCFACTYYLALYTDYDNVLGMITFKNSHSGVIIPEGNSITKVLKRNQTDDFIIYGQSRLLFQKFSGEYQVYFQQIRLSSFYNIYKIEQPFIQKINIAPKPRTFQQNYYSIDLKQCIQAQFSQKGMIRLRNDQGQIYKLYIKTQNNYPFIYYSMIIVNNESRKINLKDGVPFFNKQKNQLSVFKYLTENLQTKSFGTIIINSNQISQIQLEIYGNCLALSKTQLNLKMNNQLIKSQERSTIQKIKLISQSKRKYQFQKIQNRKLNLMANRIDIMIEPERCKNYVIKMINKASGPSLSSISYEILVSFIDSMILPLNNEVPGILQYPGKMIQIYQIFVPQKANLSIWISFCRSAKSRMQIYRNKQALFTQNSDEKVIFNSQSQLEETVYSAHSGIFYIMIQFFGFSNILEYTILIKQHQVEQGFYYIDLSKEQQVISYSVKEGRFFSTTYQLYFSPIFLKHWSKDIQRDVQYFQTNYFILESNSYPLLKRASNCKGQFFSDIVNHHEHFRQVKLEKHKLAFHPPQKQSQVDSSYTKYYERGYYSYDYETSNPLSFLIIVPVISKQKKGQNQQKQITVIPYWKFDKKSRQPFQIIQLYNGKIYSVFQHWFVSIVISAEQIVDFHAYEGFIATMILFISCLPITCCVLICTYRTKVNVQFYCSEMCVYLGQICKKSPENRVEQIDTQNRMTNVAIHLEETQNPSHNQIQNNYTQLQSNATLETQFSHVQAQQQDLKSQSSTEKIQIQNDEELMSQDENLN